MVAEVFDDANIRYLRYLIAYTAVEYSFYALHVVTFVSATYILLKRDVRASRARLWLLLVTVAMFCLATSFVAIDVFLLRENVRITAGRSTDREANYLQSTIAQNVIFRVMLMMSDTVIVWRAWVIWRHERKARIILAACLTLSYLGLMADIGVIAWETATEYYADQFYYSLILTVPTTLTNIVVTVMTGIKAWTHRRFMMSGVSSGDYSHRVFKALLVLCISGILYCALCVTFTAAGLTQRGAAHWGEIILAVGASVSGSYPTLIVIWAALERDVEPAIEVQLGVMQNTTVNFATPRDSVIQVAQIESWARQDSLRRSGQQPYFHDDKDESHDIV
ncbi:hypothetical protein BD626DRAFT_491856 [Schizophyllum amplum]|uniref:Uncharacterized protein n=1 Tax=Schizophyllum amplum TaxID=97359 RepID=A0A550CI93_9AGAR|nr:hypothetical protein BD626DRAFT_491856 [Auriculariopsis ampla]